MKTSRLESEDGSEYGTFGDRTTPEAVSPGMVVWPHDTPRKWLMLTILSVLSAVIQGVCYSYAPIGGFVETRWEQRLRSAELITVFFVGYIPCSFLGSWLMDKHGLRFGVLLGALLEALGALVSNVWQRQCPAVVSPRREASAVYARRVGGGVIGVWSVDRCVYRGSSAVHCTDPTTNTQGHDAHARAT